MIVGEGPEEESLRALVRNMGLENNIVFKNIVQATADILPVFDVFVMPSRQEGLGLAVMEAMAAGIPVVASEVGGLPDLVKNGQTGFSVPPEDVTGLAQRVKEMLADRNRAMGMARAARILIEEKFSAQTMVAQTIRVYEQYSGR